MAGGYQLYENGWNILPISNIDATEAILNSVHDQIAAITNTNHSNDITTNENDEVDTKKDEEQMEKEGEEIKNHCKGGK